MADPAHTPTLPTRHAMTIHQLIALRSALMTLSDVGSALLARPNLGNGENNAAGEELDALVEFMDRRLDQIAGELKTRTPSTFDEREAHSIELMHIGLATDPAAYVNRFDVAQQGRGQSWT